MIVCVSAGQAQTALALLEQQGEQGFIIGEVQADQAAESPWVQLI